MGRYIHPVISPPLLPSDEEIIAGIVRADPTPPDTHIDPGLAGHGSISQLDHENNEVDDIVANAVDDNANTNTNASVGINIIINSIHVFIVNLIIFAEASVSRPEAGARIRFLGVQVRTMPRVRVGRRGPSQALEQLTS
ncbi:unnamed protein product [Rhizoctonia solani]|uniref:Uncharacterized protein n=1 Tax=Rhizoctonia solani TaxID=456999 RepID=A0A8H3CMX4_9AGAM|nr:unnamed protein product [Rhizoctonia solani]